MEANYATNLPGLSQTDSKIFRHVMLPDSFPTTDNSLTDSVPHLRTIFAYSNLFQTYRPSEHGEDKG